MTITDTTTIITNPSKTFRPSDIEASLGWLDHGAELAHDLRGDKAKHRDVIWELLVEAVEVIDKSPDRERRWLTSGTRSGWKTPGFTRSELIKLERVRFLSAMKPFDSETRCLPQHDDEERALGVMGWLRWLHAAPSGDRLSKAAVALVRHDDYGIALNLYSPGRKTDRQNLNEIKVRTAGLILTGLKNDLGIVPGDGISFQRE
ncbi:hypothetical protein [Bradyrhizobium diazoefficiens]